VAPRVCGCTSGEQGNWRGTRSRIPQECREVAGAREAHLAEERGLARAEEAREERDRNLLAGVRWGSAESGKKLSGCAGVAHGASVAHGAKDERWDVCSGSEAGSSGLFVEVWPLC